MTDADLFLGYLADGAELGGELQLDRDRAERALVAVGEPLGLDALEAARGIVDVANAEMVRALRVISVERGLDPRDFALVAFGGAGGMHACALAEELGVRTVLVPRAAGVLSALGLAISDLRHDYVSPLLGELSKLGAGELEQAFAELEQSAAGDLDAPELERRADLRYHGQSFELTVEADDLGALAERFAEAHYQRYGYRMDDEPVEVVAVRLVATTRVDKPELSEDRAPEGADPETGRRRAFFDQDWQEVPVLDRAGMGRGSRVDGPAVVESTDSTCLVRPRWAAEVDGAGTLVMRRQAED